MSELSVREARDLHFKRHGLPLDGGYEDKWVPLMFGFLTFYLYNSQLRKAAVRLHDIHHAVTGYASDAVGEAEISAWELAAGVYDKHFARFINLAALFYGAYLFPRRTFTAFLRGRHSRSLYNQAFSESMLDVPLSMMQAQLLPREVPSATLYDYGYYLLLVGVANVPAVLVILSIF